MYKEINHSNQKHLINKALEPISSYSDFDTQNDWNVDNVESIDPPNQVEFNLLGWDITLTFKDLGDRLEISDCKRSYNPENKQFPPDNKIFS